jgi:DNA-binding CsgD family transcriptional regulator
MLIEDVRMCESLRRIVNGFTGDPTLQQDMLQECLVCLWKIESEKPGRTRSWYLQNCRFHVQHWLAAGRSLDSHKRALGGNRVPLHGTEEDTALDGYHTNGELFEAVSVRDLVSTLAPMLKPAERIVLRGLAEGLVLREIASRSGISYPTALKYRRRIAALALRLGVTLPISPERPNGDSVSPALAKEPLGIKHSPVRGRPKSQVAAKVDAMSACQRTRPLQSISPAELGRKPNAGKARCDHNVGALSGGGNRGRLAA